MLDHNSYRNLPADLLHKIPEHLRDAVVTFGKTGEGTQEVRDFIDASEDAQDLLEIIVKNRVNRLAVRIHDSIEETGGSYLVGETFAQVLGVDQQQGMSLAEVMFSRGERLRQEQRDIDAIE